MLSLETSYNIISSHLILTSFQRNVSIHSPNNTINFFLNCDIDLDLVSHTFNRYRPSALDNTFFLIRAIQDYMSKKSLNHTLC